MSSVELRIAQRERASERASQREREGEKGGERGRRVRGNGRLGEGWKYLDIREGMNKTKLYPQCCLRGRGALNSLNKLAESSEIFPSSGGVPNAAKTLPLTSRSSRFSTTFALVPLPFPFPPRSQSPSLSSTYCEVMRTPRRAFENFLKTRPTWREKTVCGTVNNRCRH